LVHPPKYTKRDTLTSVLAVIATEIAVLAASGAPADGAAAAAIEKALSVRGVMVVRDAQARAQAAQPVRVERFAALREARRLMADAHKHDLLVELDAAEQAALRAIDLFWDPDELSDAYILLGIVRLHRGDGAGGRAAFTRAKAYDPGRKLTSHEVHPDIARLWSQTMAPAGHEDGVAAPPPSELAPADLCDILWLDNVVVARGVERRAGLKLAAARFDRRAHAWSERVTGADPARIGAAVLSAPALHAAAPALEVPADPPPPPPPPVWRRAWFWAVVGGAAAFAGGGAILAQATRGTHTTVMAGPNTFGGL